MGPGALSVVRRMRWRTKTCGPDVATPEGDDGQWVQPGRMTASSSSSSPVLALGLCVERPACLLGQRPSLAFLSLAALDGLGRLVEQPDFECADQAVRRQAAGFDHALGGRHNRLEAAGTDDVGAAGLDAGTGLADVVAQSVVPLPLDEVHGPDPALGGRARGGWGGGHETCLLAVLGALAWNSAQQSALLSQCLHASMP